MKITICGSIAAFDEMKQIQQELESAGHQVKIPSSELSTKDGDLVPVKEFRKAKKAAADDHPWMWNVIQNAMTTHFDKITWSEAILITNYDKKGIPNYVGGNTLIEMGIALHQDKPIYLLNPIPQNVPYKEEILAMQPIIINGDFTKIKA